MPASPLRAVFLVSAAAGFLAAGQPGRAPAAPPNAPARVEVDGRSIRVTYGDASIFEGTISGGEGLRSRMQVYREGERIEQVVYLFSGSSKVPVRLAGIIRGSGEAFPCESDRRDRRGAGPLVVRHVDGLSRSLLNRAVYDRRADWALSVDAGPRAIVRPEEARPDRRSFALEAEGGEIVLRFRPRFFQKHRGLPSFEPWTYRLRPGSIAGWISWFAFFSDITEADVLETAAAFSEALAPFGAGIFQIDDGYQRGTGDPSNWLTPNGKFPRGLGFLAESIKAKGLRPGIWTAVSVQDEGYVAAHPGWFVRDASGRPAWGNWIGYALDASIDEALAAVVRPVYRALRAQGWSYFKLDALRHLRYEGYNANRDYFDRGRKDLAGAYRRYVRAVREEIGPEAYLLACWGIRPELAGLVDACRIGDDGFAYAGLAQYNSFNNVVWRNDPDHIELDEDAYRSTLVTSLTGSLYMLTDKPAVYRTAAVEPARRTIPVPPTVPGQIYDVDPSRSQHLDRAGVEVSGSGPRLFDGGYTPACFLYSLEIVRPFETWLVLGRTGGDFAEIRLADLGLEPEREYYVFEFWSKRLLGSFRTGFAPGPLDPRFRSQAFVLRERRPHPQLLATSRHVTAGGVDLDDVRWDGATLEGRSRTVQGDPYVLYLTEPQGFVFDGAEARGAKVGRTEKAGGLVRIALAPEAGGELAWTARFKKG